MIRLAIVDDHPVARWGLEHLALTTEDILVVASVASPEELPEDLEVDLVALDLYLASDLPSVPVVERLSAKHSILVISASRSDRDVVAALGAGASGYLTKDSEDEELLNGIRVVAAGGVFVAHAVADALHSPRRAEPTVPTQRLSPREQEALTYVARGFTHSRAAEEMSIAPTTFDSYIERIREKLGVGNKAELARTAVALGLVDEESRAPTVE